MRLTHERLRELLVYDPKTGKFFWRVSHGRKVKVGTEAGTMSLGWRPQIQIDRKRHKTSRLAWLYVHGYLPENQIDHIDRNPSNNRIDNLREVSQSCNMRNCGNPNNNTSGVKGVRWHKREGRWCAQIGVNRRMFYLGLYDDFDDAVCARLAAEQCLNWEGCDSSSPAYKYVKGFANELT